MSTVISSIIISGITEGYTSEYIANVLWKQGLAQVSRITMLPYLEHDSNTICFTAYADIQAWADTEAAFNFIKRLDKTFVARIVHHDDDAWHVRLNTRYNANDNVHLFAYATNFNTQYYLQPLEKGEENTLPVGEDQKLPFKQTATQQPLQKLQDYCQEMEDLIYDIEEHERLTEDEFDILFHHFGQDDDEEEDDEEEEDLEDLEEDLEDDIQDTEDTEDLEDTEDIQDLEEYLRDSHMMRLQEDYLAQPFKGCNEQPDYDYIQSILDRIDNNRISTMEQGLTQHMYTLF
jgi:hypothetical protein